MVPSPVARRVFAVGKLLRDSRRSWYLIAYKRFQSLFPKFLESHFSNVIIDIIIPVVEKDLSTLPLAIRSLRENVKHPIAEIIVVGPKSEKIKLLCNEEDCRYLNEETILPITKDSINYTVNGVRRSGWLFQQLLKLSGDEVSSKEYFLAADADTILIRPHTFLNNKGKVLLLYSDEHHLPYFEAYNQLTGLRAQSPVSFVSHYMLFHKPKLRALKKMIEEKNDMKWYDAIIRCTNKAEMSGFSEYETYGNFVLSTYPGSVRMMYSFNLRLSRSKVEELPQLTEELGHRYRSISFHEYNS
jgi:hypothetical protein